MLLILTTLLLTASLSAQVVDGEFDEVRIKGNRTFRGLILSSDERQLEIMEIVRPAGRPMYLIVRPIQQSVIQETKRVSPERRKALQIVVERFRNRARIERGRMEAVDLQKVEDGEEVTWRYQGPWFTLTSSTDQATTRRGVVRIEQIFRAYRQLLPPRTKPTSPLRILIYGSKVEYEKFLQTSGLPITNPAFYWNDRNLIVAGSDLKTFSEKLAKTHDHHRSIREHYRREDAQLNRRLIDLGRQLKASGFTPVQIATETAARRKAWRLEMSQQLRAIELAEKRNAQQFDRITEQMFRRLYHEAFHAYLENFLYPAEKYDVPRWLNEGLAQVFEGGQLDGEMLRIDAPRRDLAIRLRKDMRDGTPLPLAKMLSAGQPAFLLTHSTENGGTAQHYLYAWGLAHYLLLGESFLKTEKMDQYVHTESARFDPAERLQRLLGKPLGTFEQTWRKWASK